MGCSSSSLEQHEWEAHPLAAQSYLAHRNHSEGQEPPLPLRVADSYVVPARMISIPDTLLQRAALIVLTLYAGAFLGQTLCVLHSSHTDSAHQEDLPAHAPLSMAAHMSLTATDVSSSMVADSPSQHGEHSDSPGQNHSGACAVVACGSAITVAPDLGLPAMSRFSNPLRAYQDRMMPPEAEMVSPPPRLG